MNKHCRHGWTAPSAVIVPRARRGRPSAFFRATRLVATVALLAGMLAAHSAQARNVDAEVAALSINIDKLALQGENLKGQMGPGRSFLSPGKAVERFQDCVYLHMIGEHEFAAEGFFTLVTTGALTDAGLHRDAEWYLAEALFAMENFGTAEARFKVISEEVSHPFRPDAVRRLLELYAFSGQDDAFEDMYQQEIVRGLVKPNDLITYTVAKSFYHQGNMVKAKSYLLEVPPDSAVYRRARYFLGTTLVVDRELDAAIEYFEEVASLSVETIDDRKILDLSLLAIGRIHYELGRFAQAAEYYGRVGGDSEYLADKLYEIVWTFIKQDEFQEALRAVEIFLLAFPEHEYTAQLKLIEGHLHLQQVQYDSALSSYEQVIIDYTPIRERFAQLSTSQEEGKHYFQKLASGKRSDGESLPPYVDALLVADEDMAHAIFVYRELESQAQDISKSEQLINELAAALQTANGLGGFDDLRIESRRLRLAVVFEQLSLLDTEEAWLGEVTDEKAELDSLREQRENLLRRVRERRAEMEAAQSMMVDHNSQMAGVRSETSRLAALVNELDERARLVTEELADPTIEDAKRAELEEDLAFVRADLKTATDNLAEFSVDEKRGGLLDALAAAEVALFGEAEKGVGDLRREYRSLRSRASIKELGTQIDRLHLQVNKVGLIVDDAVARLSAMERSELERIRTRYEAEVREVASQRVEHARTVDEATELSYALTKSGFGRLEDFFAESVLKADMGIVDVYWSQKLEVADQKERVKEEKQALLNDLDQRFRVIKQKLRQ